MSLPLYMAMTPRQEAAVRVATDSLEIVASPLLRGSGIVRDYIAGADLRRFFTGHYTDTDAYERKAAEVAERLGADARAAIVPAIEALGDSRPRLDRILNGDGFLVTTGQQPALFGGPLYTLYKILGAIRTAEILEARLGKPVLALFWIGSDDHDWDEANHNAAIDADEYVRRITVRASRDAAPLPLSQRRWGAGIQRAIAELAEVLPDTSDGRDVLAHVREAYTPDATVSASFTATMRWLLRDRRVAMIDSAHPLLRQASVPILIAEAERTIEHNGILADQAAHLEESGYRVQVPISRNAANIMLIGAQGRDRLTRSDRGWGTRRSRSVIEHDVLLDMIRSEPERFSPNVLLRPVIENAVLPTIAYVAGPGEVSYYAQIGCLYEAHGILPPVVIPRPSVTLIEPKVRKLLDRLGIDPAFVARPFREVVADAVSAQMPQQVERALISLRNAITSGYDDLIEAARGIDPELSRGLLAPRNASLLDVNAAERKIRGQVRRANQVRIEQLRRAAAHIHPVDTPQERVLGPLPFIARYGRGIVASIEAELDPLPPRVASWEGPHCD